MLLRKYNVSSRSLFQLTVAMVFLLAAVGAAAAAGVTNTGNAPLLVPTQMSTIIGITQYGPTNNQITGFSGDGGAAVETMTAGVPGNVNGINTAAKWSGGAALNSPPSVAVDSVGNVYVADMVNGVVREVNAATGTINTIAGVAPSGCNAATAVCTTHYSGCTNGVPAYGTPIIADPQGVAVDSFGNVFFTSNNGTGLGAGAAVYVIYRGGTRVADFINRVNPLAIAKTGGVAQVGYLYFISGAVNTGTCAITQSTSLVNGLPFTDLSVSGSTASTALENADYVTLDAAGNVYISEGNANSNTNVPENYTVVINTQETPQTFFQYTVQPGYQRQIVNCSAATSGPCQQTVTSNIGTGINGPVNQITFGGGQYQGGEVDGYGNLYQTNGSGGGTGVPGIYGAIAYAGGPGITNYLSSTGAGGIYTKNVSAGYTPTETVAAIPPVDSLIPNELPLTYGNSYNGQIYDIIRPNYLDADMYGSLWFTDQHYPLVVRLDQYTGAPFTLQNGSGRSTTNSGLGNVFNANGSETMYANVASITNPWNCHYGSGNASSPLNLVTQDTQSYDPKGDNCYVQVTSYGGSHGAIAEDNIPNAYVIGQGQGRVFEVNVGTQFPSHTNPPSSGVVVGQSLTQWVQVHFDATNIPTTGGSSSSSGPAFTSTNVTTTNGNLAYTTNAFSVMSTTGEFTLDTTTPEFAMQMNTVNNYGQGPTSGVNPYAGLPTCSQLNPTWPDASWDCLAFIKFSPSQPGYRTGTLVATTANGSTYTFQLTGIGLGSQLAIDGGQQSTVATTTGLSSGLGTGVTSIAISQQTGNIYTADPKNNRIVVTPTAGSATAIGPALTVVLPSSFLPSPAPVQSLSGPQGVAVDAAGNVYISDTGNKRILEYNPITAIATVIGNYIWIPGAACDGGTTSPAVNVNCTFTNYTSNTLASAQSQSIKNELGAAVTPTVAPPQYQWGQPLGLAVDGWGNVYVVDGGNASASPVIPPQVVMIPANISLGGATPLLQYPGAPTFTSPVAVAVGPGYFQGKIVQGFIYVADTQNIAGEVVRIPPGGGDLQPAGTLFPGSALNVVSTLPLFGGLGITNPNGVAVDAAGDVYVSDASGNAVWEAPAAGPPTGNPFTVSFSGLSNPSGLALDANGNLYVYDTGNNRLLTMNRQNPSVPFGTVPEGLSASSGVAGTPVGCPVLGSGVACTGVLTVTNIGNQPATLTLPFLGTVTNSQFKLTTNCASPLPVGVTCTITPLLTPTTSAAISGSVTVNATQSLALMANGALPEVNIVLTPSNGTGTSPNYAVSAPGAETITATVSQTHVSSPVTPTGTVQFSYVIDAGTPNAGLCPSSAASSGSGAGTLVSPGVWSYAIPGGVAAGQSYTVSAVFTPGSSDTQDSTTNSQTPIILTVAPTTAEAVTAASVTFQYGNAVPALTGTVSPALASGVSVSFISGASQYSNVGVYPIQPVFTGTNFCSFGTPVAYSSGTTPATVTETTAKLSVAVPAYITVYGAAAFNFASGMTITGAVGSDFKKLSATFTPADSSVLNVGTYPVVATMTGKPIGNYAVTITNGTDTVTPAPSVVGITAAKTGTPSSSLNIGAQGVVLNTASAISSATYTISVGSQVIAGKGTPTGSVLVYDYFVPITSSTFYATPLSGNFPSLNGVLQWPSSTIMPCTAAATPVASTTCTPVTVAALSGGNATFVPPAFVSGTASPYYSTSGTVVVGTHYFVFLYTGDAGSNGDGLGNFACSVNGQTSTALPSAFGATQTCGSTGSNPYALVVDNPDFTFTSTTAPLPIAPGTIPSGNGLPSVPGQNGSFPGTAIIEIGGINNFIGTVNLTCTPQNPSYVSCFVGQETLVNGSVQVVPYVAVPCVPPTCSSSTETVPVIVEVSTPATLPLGFNTASVLDTTATRTVLAFLPFGVLAFCVRRRRRLSKALWMLIAIAAVGTVMSGCGGNNVAFYTPVPTGAQIVTVNATYTSITPSEPTVTRTFVVPINID